MGTIFVHSLLELYTRSISTWLDHSTNTTPPVVGARCAHDAHWAHVLVHHSGAANMPMQCTVGVVHCTLRRHGGVKFNL
jgi:hypothetical protein